MAEIVACGQGGLYDFLGFSGVKNLNSSELEKYVAQASDTVVLVTDGVSCSSELIENLEERFPSRFIPVVLDPKRGVDVSSAKRLVEKALGVKLDR
jgi:hypothetical protein